MNAPRLDEKTKLAIIKAYRDGEKLSVIASIFHVHNSYATILIKRRGFTVRRLGGRKYA